MEADPLAEVSSLPSSTSPPSAICNEWLRWNMRSVCLLLLPKDDGIIWWDEPTPRSGNLNPDSLDLIPARNSPSSNCHNVLMFQCWQYLNAQRLIGVLIKFWTHGLQEVEMLRFEYKEPHSERGGTGSVSTFNEDQWAVSQALLMLIKNGRESKGWNFKTL